MIFVAALVVLALGWIGLFFGRLIQAAVSRNRESLADASAVQFTRDPQGLRNALVKIGALGAGSRFADADAEEVAHLLFAEGIQRAFATHPPLVERIREIDPRFQPSEFDEVRRRMGEARAMAEEEAARDAPAAARRGGLLEGAVVLAPAAVAVLVANPGTEHVLKAQAMLESLPDVLPARGAPAGTGDGTVRRARDRHGAGGARAAARVHPASSTAANSTTRSRRCSPQVDALTAVQRMPALLQVFAALSQLGARRARRAAEVPERLAGAREPRLGRSRMRCASSPRCSCRTTSTRGGARRAT